MKAKKQIIRVSLISIILMLFLACVKVSYGSFGDVIGTIAVDGVIAWLTWGMQKFGVVIFAALQSITALITGAASDGGEAVAGIGDVVFNRCALTTANFFGNAWSVSTVTFGTESLAIMENVRKFYYIIRNLSIAILLGILLYVGIRMAISTVASEEAKYKKMLKDWAISLVLVFVLHYIIIITFFINDTLVNVLASFEDKPTVIDWAGLAIQAAIPRSWFC